MSNHRYTATFFFFSQQHFEVAPVDLIDLQLSLTQPFSLFPSHAKLILKVTLCVPETSMCIQVQ